MAVVYSGSPITGKEIVGTFAFVALILVGVYFFTHQSVVRSCGGIYPNPAIAGCGVYSQQDFDRKWCEEQGGHLFAGGFSSNCVLPAKKQK